MTNDVVEKMLRREIAVLEEQACALVAAGHAPKDLAVLHECGVPPRVVTKAQLEALTHPIPPITHRLGRYWEQPDRLEILVDDTHAVMSRRAYARLANYETSLPSGVYGGKMWRRGNLLCWFVDLPLQPSACGVRQREILVLE